MHFILKLEGVHELGTPEPSENCQCLIPASAVYEEPHQKAPNALQGEPAVHQL